jgi:uncharacterized membrane protein YccC
MDAYRKSFAAITAELLEPGPTSARERERTRQAARTARTNLETSLERLAVEPGVTQERIAQANAMLASSHRFAHAIMALEAGIPRAESRNQAPPRPEFRRFAAAADQTLNLLTAKIRGQKVAERDFPDLREAHLRLASSGDPQLERYALTNVEADRMTNSLNTLREQVFAWKRLTR